MYFPCPWKTGSFRNSGVLYCFLFTFPPSFLSLKVIFLYVLRLPVSFRQIKLSESRSPEACPHWQSGESKQRGASTGNNDLRDGSLPFHPPLPRLELNCFLFLGGSVRGKFCAGAGVGAEEGWSRRKVAAVGGGGGRGQYGTPAAPGPRGEQGRGGPAATAGSLSARATWTKGVTRMNSPSLPRLSRVNSSSATLSKRFAQLSSSSPAA